MFTSYKTSLAYIREINRLLSDEILTEIYKIQLRSLPWLEHDESKKRKLFANAGGICVLDYPRVFHDLLKRQPL